MHRVLFLLAAVGFLAGSLSWVAGARRAYHRALVVEHRGLQAAQWRSLAAKDALAGALLLSLVPVLVATAVQGRTSAADWFLLVAVVPLLGSLAWIRRFHRLAGLIETEADYAQQQRERVSQEAELASILAARLRAESVLSAVLAGSRLADALTLGNALLGGPLGGGTGDGVCGRATAMGCCATPTPATCPAISSTAAPAPPSSRWHPPGRCLAWSSIRCSKSARWRWRLASG